MKHKLMSCSVSAAIYKRLWLRMFEMLNISHRVGVFFCFATHIFVARSITGRQVVKC